MQFIGTSKEDYLAMLIFNASSLPENVEKIPEMFNEIVYSSKYDSKLIKQTLAQMINSQRMGIIGNGMGVAMASASSEHDAVSSITSNISGYNKYVALNAIMDNFNIQDLKSHFKAIIEKVFAKNRAMLTITSSENNIETTKEALKSIKLKKKYEANNLERGQDGTSKKALVIPAQISYNAIAANLGDFGMEYTGTAPLVSHILRYGYLWDEVRVKGGAYGAAIQITRTGTVSLGSYRDPNVVNTYSNFKAIGEYLDEFAPTKAEFTNYIIGALGGFDKPVSVRIQASTADLNYLTGLTKKERISRKKELVRAKIEDVKGYSKFFKEFASKSSEYTVGCKAKIDEYPFDEIKSF